MKTTFIHLMATAAITFVPTFGMAQQQPTENPRGVYKLIEIIDKTGTRISAPFDQYKICTDSVTLMLAMQGSRFSLGKNDSKVFNYTGEEPDANDTTATRIFDSNAEHFTLKWWSTYPFHLYFPNNDWCTEFYESGKYSENAKTILDALMSPNATDRKCPFIGTWRMVGMMDELRNTKQQLKKLHEDDRYKANIGYIIFTPNCAIMYSNRNRGGSVELVGYNGKKEIIMGHFDPKAGLNGGHRNAITWLGKDCFAMEVQLEGYRTDYEIWERVTDSTPLFNRIASQYVVH